MPVYEPPQIVFEAPAVCTDRDKAEEQLRRALVPSVGPKAGWTVTLRVEKRDGALEAAGEITDENGAPVGHRELRASLAGRRGVRDCAPLARAMGVWASLVLDAQVERAKAAEAAEARDRDSKNPQVAVAALWPAPVVNEPPPPEAALFLAHQSPDKRSIEIGASGFLMDGAGTGALAGPAIFAVIEVGNAVYLRPTLAIGRTVQPLPASDAVFGTWGAGRLDTCKRLAGMYLDRRGLQLDGCAGGEIGFVSFNDNALASSSSSSSSSHALPFMAVGPSIGLRGELASDFAVELRGIAGLNILRGTFVDSTGQTARPALFVGRAELGITWRIR